MSRQVNLANLMAYRTAVGFRTRDILLELSPGRLKQRVDPSNFQRLLAEGAVVQSANDLIKYWGGLTVAGLLLMPPTRQFCTSERSCSN